MSATTALSATADLVRGLAVGGLGAANRGVRVRIVKDRDGAVYERQEGSGQSLFHKETSLYDTAETLFLTAAYEQRIRRTQRQRPSPLAAAVRDHPNIELRETSCFDHAKLYVFEAIVFHE